MKITLVELPATINGELLTKPILDFYSLTKLPSRALPYLHGILQQYGYQDVEQINPSFNKKGILTKENMKRLVSSDVVGISCITRTARQSYQLARLIKEYNPQAYIILGGTHPSAIADEALLHSDIVVRKEGDMAFPEILARIVENQTDPYLKDILGISYKQKGCVYHNEDRPFLTNEELSRLPLPIIRDVEIEKSHAVSVITSRGCAFQCEYCSVIENFGRRFRYLDDDSVLTLIQHFAKKPFKRLFFADDCFTGNPKRTKRLLEKILQKNIKMQSWSAQMRVESAYDDELLDLMKRTGCSYVYVGLESVNDATLALYNKKSSLAKNREAIERFHAKKLDVHGMFVLGAQTDDQETIQQTLDFAKQLHLATAQFFALTPLPGTKMAKKYEENNQILSKTWNKYDCQHVMIHHDKMTPSELQAAIDNIGLKFYSVKEAFRELFCGHDRLYKFYIRLAGHLLARKIVHSHKAHHLVLKDAEAWHDIKFPAIAKNREKKNYLFPLPVNEI